LFYHIDQSISNI